MYVGVVDGDLTELVFDSLPTPVTESRYECASEFVTDPIAHAIEPAIIYGLLIVERGGAALGELRDDRVIPIREFESQVMGKQEQAGSQHSDSPASVSVGNTSYSRKSPTPPRTSSATRILSTASCSVARRSPVASSARTGIWITGFRIVSSALTRSHAPVPDN